MYVTFKFIKVQYVFGDQNLYKQENNGDNQTPFFDSLCTCKECSHHLSMECVNANCVCCKEGSHSMVLDGMAGFEPPRKKKDEDQIE